jgi:HlyD family secretion protein
MWRVLKSRRLVVGLLIVGGLLALALWPRSLAVDVAEAKRGPLLVTIDEEGETRVRARFVVTAPVAGDVQRIALEPGDPIARGQRLAVVQPAAPTPLDARTRAEATAAVSAAEAVEARAVAERDRLGTAAAFARQQLERAQRLLKGGAIAREELEARETEARTAGEALRAAEFAVAQARHEVQAARARLGLSEGGAAPPAIVVTSPVDGVVLRRHVESRRVVAPGEPLLEIGDPSRLEIVADLLSADAVTVHTGAPVIIDEWGGAEPIRGRVRRIEPSGFTKVSALGVEEQRVNVIIDFDDAPAAVRALGDGYRVEVRIVRWQDENVLTVPIGALFRRPDLAPGQSAGPDDWAVFVIDEGLARLRRVSIGQRNASAAEVVEGLVEGDRVVLFPPDTLVDGQRVEPRRR